MASYHTKYLPHTFTYIRYQKSIITLGCSLTASSGFPSSFPAAVSLAAIVQCRGGFWVTGFGLCLKDEACFFKNFQMNVINHWHREDDQIVILLKGRTFKWSRCWMHNYARKAGFNHQQSRKSETPTFRTWFPVKIWYSREVSTRNRRGLKKCVDELPNWSDKLSPFSRE